VRYQAKGQKTDDLSSEKSDRVVCCEDDKPDCEQECGQLKGEVQKGVIELEVTGEESERNRREQDAQHEYVPASAFGYGQSQVVKHSVRLQNRR
jgi:hypothetical protein